MSKRSLSSQKAVRQNERRRLRNKANKSALKSQVRKLLAAIATGDAAAITNELGRTTAGLSRAAARGTIHRNAARRRVSRLARRANVARTAQK